MTEPAKTTAVDDARKPGKCDNQACDCQWRHASDESQIRELARALQAAVDNFYGLKPAFWIEDAEKLLSRVPKELR